MPLTILLATSNPHKRGEIVAVWEEEAVREPGAGAVPTLIGLDTLGWMLREPIEDQPTFEGNAVVKARHYANEAGMLCLADDSGLEVDALGGEPGVRSARYAGVAGPREQVDRANNALLLEKLGPIEPAQRTARFVCAMALCAPEESSWHGVAGPAAQPLAVVRGVVEGRIIGPGEAPRGPNGFGYDPLFFVPELGKTTAELTPQQKNAVSHRGQAARLMYRRIREMSAYLASLAGTSARNRP